MRYVLMLGLLAAAVAWRQAAREWEGVKVLPPDALDSSLRGDHEDTVVYFYAPWCPNCAQFDRIWNDLAAARDKRRGERRASLTKFDCEASVEAMRLCSEAGVDRYPSVIYFGRESFGRRRNGDEKHAVAYPGELYAEAVNSWIGVMEGTSWWKTLSNWARGLGRRKRRRRQRQQSWKSATTAQPQQGREPARAAKESGLPQAVSRFADAFLALGDVVEEYKLALQTCVADLSLEYCKGVEAAGLDEPYCGIVEECYTQAFQSEQCRPATGCPFEESGCETVNLCVNPSVLMQYHTLLKQEGLVPS